jgi:hypothetical protein
MRDIGRATTSHTLRQHVICCGRFVLPVLRRLAEHDPDARAHTHTHPAPAHMHSAPAGAGRGAEAYAASDEAICCDMLQEIRILPRLERGLRFLLLPAEAESHLSRQWLGYTAGFVSFVSAARFLYLHSDYNGSGDLKRWVSVGKENSHQFLREHLFDPANAICQELFGGGLATTRRHRHT